MGVEIERKFLVIGDDWRAYPSVYYCQGYLCTDKDRTVRIRIAGDRGLITIKGATRGASRKEYEYEVPLNDAREMLQICVGPLIEKLRREIPAGEHTWEVDEFLGENLGLVVAEIELDSEHQSIDLPDWIGAEVTTDHRYFNSQLTSSPYSHWKENG